LSQKKSPFTFSSEKQTKMAEPDEILITSSSFPTIVATPGTPEPAKLTLKVTFGNLNLKTVAMANWTVGDTIQRIRRKLPGETSNCHLFIKTGRNAYKPMDDSKILGDYKQLEDPKVILEFDTLESFDKAKKRSKAPDTLHKREKSEDLRMKPTVMEAIRRSDYKGVEKFFKSLPKEILEAEDENGKIALHAAIQTADLRMFDFVLKQYLAKNMDLNLPDRSGLRAIHYAVSNSTGSKRDDDEIIRQMLEIPEIQIDVVDSENNTPLHYFCEKFTAPTCMDIGERIIKRVPSLINKKNNKGETPLHKALFNEKVRVLMVKVLIDQNADVNVATLTTGDTVLHYAAKLGRKDLLKMLLQVGADPSIVNSSKKTAFEVAMASNQQEMAKPLKICMDLRDWLAENNLEQYLPAFLKQEQYLDNIIVWEDQKPREAFISTVKFSEEDANRFRDAAHKLRETASREAFEASLKKVSKRKASVLNIHNQAIQEKIGNLRKDLTKLVHESHAVEEEEDEDLSWLISHSELEFTKELGSGVSGTVYKGLYKGEKVAIKILKSQNKDPTIEEFKKEFLVMSALESPHIVRFFGACLEPRICIVMGFCNHGSLYDVLNDEQRKIDWDDALKWASQICQAVDCLHSFAPPIFHRDLKSLNLLVDINNNIKVCDFGLARFNSKDNMETMGKVRGTYAYLAPELFHAGIFTSKCDIYSLGIILTETAGRVATGKYVQPYSEFPFIKMDFQIFFYAAEKDLRPSIPPGTPAFFEKIIKRAVDGNPDNRPTAKELVAELELVTNNSNSEKIHHEEVDVVV